MTPQLASTSVDPATEPTTEGAAQRWRRAPGLELMGRAQDSGLKHETYMVRRSDGQIIQISALLYLVLEEIDPDRSDEEIAERVSAAYGKVLDADGLRHLVTKYLTELGVAEIVGAEKSATPLPRAKTIMSLTMRLTIIPARVVRAISRVLAPVYHPAIVSAALAAWITLGVLLIVRGDIWASFDEVLQTPVLVLGMMVVLAACAIVHELGHATATTYGGARPGRIGVGVYIVFFAYFTDVSDSYRLNRTGRIRVDLGGLYFNILTAVALSIGYLTTGSGFLLLTIVILHTQMAQQLLPTGRFDGYYLIGDISGVPDLFSRAKPALKSLLPWGDKSGVADLKPWVRNVVVIWTVVVIPLLLFLLGLLLWSLPAIVTRTWAAGVAQAERLAEAANRGDAPVVVIAAVSIIAVALPLIGIAVILWRISVSLLRWAWTSLRPKPPEPPAPRSARPPAATRARRTADDFTDELMLPTPAGESHALPEEARGRRARGRSVEVGRSTDLLSRLRTPIEGTRRVMVISRKGGVGKTTLTMALGHAYAETRGDRAIAVDANPDAGNLAHRTAPTGPHTITDVLQQIDEITSYAQLRGYTDQSTESHLEVLAADDDPQIARALGQADYDRLIELLDRYYNLILLDTGTGILDSANQGLLTAADQLVLVLRAGIDSGRAAALTLDWLDAHGYSRLVRSAVVVVNAVSTEIGAPVESIAEHFIDRCAKVITVPWDPELEIGGRTHMSALQPDTRAAFDKVAASVAELFGVDGRAADRPRTWSAEGVVSRNGSTAPPAPVAAGTDGYAARRSETRAAVPVGNAPK